MISFNVNYGNFENTIISIESTQTIFDLKANIVTVLDVDFNSIKIILENYGILDTEDTLELPLEIFGLDSSKYYSLFIHNQNLRGETWKLMCSEKIIGKKAITQVGYITGEKHNIPLCTACKLFCHKDEGISKQILENAFYCMCQATHCLFKNMSFYENETDTIHENINSILKTHAETFIQREKNRVEAEANEIRNRNFDFARSIKFGLQRVYMYEEPNVKSKILSVIPLDKIKEEALENCKISGDDFRDEQVKSLLSWFKKGFFKWCDRPICINCNKTSDKYLESIQPNEEEQMWLASRTEIYNCTGCNSECRFPRFNNPAKLCETRTGRCGEWANLFGAVLKALDYEVRFVDNFEDHVWNEYWSQSLNRWVHIDSCENAWDTPLMYEQGWGRNMTFILAHSSSGVYDVTRRYVKDWPLIAARRSTKEIDKLEKCLENENIRIRSNYSKETCTIFENRDLTEQMELLKLKTLKEAETVGRISGSEEWRKQRGEIK
jgi:peptide-N4-(N-acetyl-beta-glucosaminyl)asparagine amidase